MALGGNALEGTMAENQKPAPELFYLYRRGLPLNVYADRSIIDGWLKNAPWMYPPDECEIVRYVLADGPPEPCGGRLLRLRWFFRSILGARLFRRNTQASELPHLPL
jgi:hypothetical protein